MTIPARHVRRAKAAHGFIAINDILESFIQGGANVDIPVGKRRAVVENKSRGRGALGLDRLVKAIFFPVGHPRWFTLHQICPHGEISFG